MSDIIVVASLAEAAVITAAFLLAQHEWNRERARLLDRIMARDWDSYTIARRVEAQGPARPQPADPDEEALRESSNGLL